MKLRLLGPGCGSPRRGGGVGPGRAYLLILAALGFTLRRAETCVFPSYVQSSGAGAGGERDWRGMIRDQNREVKLK